MKSIAAKIITCIGGIVLAAMVIVCVVTSTMASRDMRQSEDRIVQLSNQTSVSNVSNYLLKYITIAQQMALDQNVVELMQSGSTVENMKDSPYYSGAFTMLSNLMQNESENIMSAYISSANTNLAFDGKDWFPDDFNLKSRSYWFSEQSDIDSGYIITEPYLDPHTNNIVTTISVPVYGLSGDILGVTAIDIQITTICDMVVNAQTSFKTGSQMLISRGGAILAHLNQDLLMQGLDSAGYSQEMLDELSIPTGNAFQYSENGEDAFAVIGQESLSKFLIVTSVPQKEYQEAASQLVLVNASTYLIAITIVILIILLIAKSISKPLKRLTAITDDLAAGNLDVSIDVHSKDEVGRLAASMQSLVTRLREYIAYISETSELLEQIGHGNLDLKFKNSYDGDFAIIKNALLKTSAMLNKMLTELRDVSNNVSSHALQVSNGSQTLAQGATEQASSVEELSAMVTTVASGITENATNAVQASSLSKEAESSLVESNQHMKKMANSMEHINSASLEIQNIIKVIDNIAFQTNLLALNAAVEAARAGEAGKGFSVVAEEVRNLAQQSTEAAKSTAELIETAVAAVKEGAEISAATEKSMKDASLQAAEAMKMMQAISEETEKQSVSVEQIRVGIDQISTVVQVNAATAEESAASSHELLNYAEHQLELISVFHLSGEVSDEIHDDLSIAQDKTAEISYESAKVSLEKPVKNNAKEIFAGKY
ncbi:methyl-accepting chemotaxis protein [Oscillibacter sp.]|uniref:methyl-accepting chemotaxis protein n=2 Tax=unclassified Oscillibacter TaxID=2629304 RepID=UPI002897C216|nr:methyl-accepting chemotaxis protein [Oscillibacter sp.]